MTGWKKATRVILILLAAVMALAFVQSQQIVAFYYLRQMARRYPGLGETPKPLEEVGVSEASGTTINRFGYGFDVPWDDVDVIRDGKSISVVTFKSGISVLFTDPSRIVSPYKVLKGDYSDASKRVKFLLAADSDYSLTKAILGADPPGPSFLLLSRRRAAAYNFLLVAKIIYISESEPIFGVNTQHWRGFQIGDAGSSNHLVLRLFDDDDHEIEIRVVRNGKLPLHVRQLEINRIIQSLHRMSDKPAGPVNPPTPS